MIKTDDTAEYRRLVEGAWIVQRGGYTYLFFSGDNCCGPKAHYAVMVARSRSATGPFETLAQATGRIVDLTHTFDEAFPTFDGVPGIQKEWAVRIEESGYQLWKLTIFEHSATHIDAPLHFAEDGLYDLPRL